MSLWEGAKLMGYPGRALEGGTDTFFDLENENGVASEKGGHVPFFGF